VRVASRVQRALAVALVLAAAAFLLLWFAPSDHFIYVPDPARPVDPLVHVRGERPRHEPGGIYMVDVGIHRASLLERFFPAIHPGSTLVPEKDFLPPGVSEQEEERESLEEMKGSQLVAKAVALRSLGYKVPGRGVEVVSVSKGFPAQGVLADGDVIVSIDGKRVRTPDDLTSVMATRTPGDRVTLRIRRAGRERELTVGTRADPANKKRALMGIAIEPKVALPVQVRIDAGQIGGPSAGLAFALDIVDELGRDVDRGRRIVVTGALAFNGRVLPIGGIKQKTLGARDAHADAFVVPEANAAQARRYADGLRIIPVRTFAQALSALAPK
jgi:PDZ domain-containing protein